MPEWIIWIWDRARRPFAAAAAAFLRSAPMRAFAAHPLGARLLADAVFRSGVFLYLGLIVNCAYGAAQMLAGVWARSVWLGALAAYHSLLAVMQFRLLRYVRRHGGTQDSAAEWRQYRLCGAALLCMTPVLAGILILIVHQNSRAGYPGFLIYFAAVYAFAKTGTAVSGAVKLRRYGSPVLSAAKTLSLVAAMISVLSLETAVLFRYGSLPDPVFYQGMLGTLGGAVCVLTLSRAVAMIVWATRQLKPPGTEKNRLSDRR